MTKKNLHNYHFRNLVFEGGGVKGIAYVGALEVLEKEGILQNIERVAGTSAGAMVAVLVGLGYTASELKDILWKINFKNFMDSSWGIVRDTKRLLTDYGWYKGDFFRNLMGGYVKEKTGNSEATFKDLEQLRKKGKPFRELTLVGCDLTTGYAKVFSAATTPDAKIADAARISMSIPLFFAAVKGINGNDHIYVDGGLLDNYSVKTYDQIGFVADKNNARRTEYYEKINEKLRAKNLRMRSSAKPNEYVYNKETLGFRLGCQGRHCHLSQPKQPAHQGNQELLHLHQGLGHCTHRRAKQRASAQRRLAAHGLYRHLRHRGHRLRHFRHQEDETRRVRHTLHRSLFGMVQQRRREGEQMKSRITLILLALCLIFTAKAQETSVFKDSRTFYEADFRLGKYYPFEARHAYMKVLPQYGLDLRLGRQTDGRALWEKDFNYLNYGAFLRFEKNNVDSIQFKDRDENGYERETWRALGDCYSLGGFINGHLYRGKYWSFDYDIMGGLSFWTKHGDEFIGSVANVHLAIDAGPTFMIEDNFDLLLRYQFSHSSNAAFRLPNCGINVFSWLVGSFNSAFTVNSTRNSATTLPWISAGPAKPNGCTRKPNKCMATATNTSLATMPSR